MVSGIMSLQKNYIEQLDDASSLRNRFRHLVSPIASPLRRKIRLEKNGVKVLDIGAGKGGLLQTLHRINPELEFMALDLTTADTFLLKDIARINGNIYQLPFHDQSIDVVILSHVLEHLENTEQALREIKRILTHEGWFYIETPNQRSCLMPFGLSFWDDPTHVRPYSANGLDKLVTMHGFNTLYSGSKKSWKTLVASVLYFLIYPLTKDPAAKNLLPSYLFLLFSYVIAQK